MTATRDPAHVGGYRLLGLLGEGGMGVVHLAEDATGHRVALKLLRPHVVGDEQARRRFAQEVSSLSRVTSHRVAEIVDADPWGPEPFVVTRFVDGPSLSEHVRADGPLDEPVLRRFAGGLAEALAAVHRVGVLHRDVKPGNVLLEGPPDALDPVLIDFGLARMAEDPHLTGTGWLLGTPGYLAPEILYGEEPTPAADVHAWAATVVFAATGRPPAGRGPAMAVLDRVRRGEMDLGGVPATVLPLLEAALAPEPVDRPPLSAVLAALGGHQPPPPTAEPTLVLERLPRAVRPGTTERLPVLGAAEEGHPDDPRHDVRHDAAYDAPYEAPWDARHDGASGPFAAEPAAVDPPRRGRRAAGLLGLGLALAALIALAPYVGLAVLAVLALLLRFASVTRERHRRRREFRGRPRWYDVPASTLASPAYLVTSLGGTVLLLGWTAALLAALAVLLAGLHVALGTGLSVAGLAAVASLWWGPASARVRESGRRLAAPLGRPTGTGAVVGLAGIAIALALLVALLSHGPFWTPASAAPWTSGWLDQVRSHLR
ncbi:MAG: serine/threonine-protein kinase [Marmoricola sp.]